MVSTFIIVSIKSCVELSNHYVVQTNLILHCQLNYKEKKLKRNGEIQTYCTYEIQIYYYLMVPGRTEKRHDHVLPKQFISFLQHKPG